MVKSISISLKWAHTKVIIHHIPWWKKRTHNNRRKLRQTQNFLFRHRHHHRLRLLYMFVFYSFQYFLWHAWIVLIGFFCFTWKTVWNVIFLKRIEIFDKNWFELLSKWLQETLHIQQRRKIIHCCLLTGNWFWSNFFL